jgi:hypothetical protein
MIFLKSGTNTNTAQQRFDELLLDAIDEVLSSLGEPVRNHLYIHLKNDFLISRNELPQRIEEFSDFLYRIFGSSAQHLEIKFIQTLYSKISVDQDVEDMSIVFKETDVTFLNYVNKMRESFEISRQ